MKYLYQTKKKKRVAHIWTGEDTACTMWSTGGLSKSASWTIAESDDGRRHCQTCLNNLGKPVKKKKKSKQKSPSWFHSQSIYLYDCTRNRGSQIVSHCVSDINYFSKAKPVCDSSSPEEIAYWLVRLGMVKNTSITDEKKAKRLMSNYTTAVNGWRSRNHKKDEWAKKVDAGMNPHIDPRAKDFLRSWEWRTLRYKVLQAHGRRCMCCGATPNDGKTKICVDHIKPRHTHPQLAMVASNLQVLCDVCNMGKGAWDDTDFRPDDNVIDWEQIRLAHEAKNRQ